MLLERLMDLEKTPRAKAYGEKEYDLSGFRAFLESLGNPHSGLKFIHVAGTKGKGSTVALSEAILRGLGLPTGIYCSPHLEHFGERIRIDGQPLSPAQFEEALQAFHDSLDPAQRRGFEGPHPWRTVFETLTALALIEFRSRQSALRKEGRRESLAVCWETGLGGRLDCTNVVDPVVSVITTMGLDHVKILGSTIEAIASEKAGIIKAGRPVILSRQTPEFEEAVVRVVRQRAAEVGAPVIHAHDHNPVLSATACEEGQWVRVRLPDGREEESLLPLHGDFQHGNLEAAIAASWYFWRSEGRLASEFSLKPGLGLAVWPGRMEMHHKSNGRILLLDGAHCPLSAKALGRSIADMKDFHPTALLFSMHADKNQEGFIAALKDALSGSVNRLCIYTYTLEGPRAKTATELAAIAEGLGFRTVVCQNARDAFDQATRDHSHVMAAGTLYTLALFRGLWSNSNA